MLFQMFQMQMDFSLRRNLLIFETEEQKVRGYNANYYYLLLLLLSGFEYGIDTFGSIF